MWELESTIEITPAGLQALQQTAQRKRERGYKPTASGRRAVRPLQQARDTILLLEPSGKPKRLPPDSQPSGRYRAALHRNTHGEGTTLKTNTATAKIDVIANPENAAADVVLYPAFRAMCDGLTDWQDCNEPETSPKFKALSVHREATEAAFWTALNALIARRVAQALGCDCHDPEIAERHQKGPQSTDGRIDPAICLCSCVTASPSLDCNETGPGRT